MTALLLLDFQNDFFPLGTVEAQGADKHMVETANRLIPCFDYAAACGDQHPADHQHFAANHLWRRPWQTMTVEGRERLLWPMHGVAGSFGAEWAPGLNTSALHRTFFKGTQPDATGYSAFEGEGFSDWLEECSVRRLFLMGPLLEYSVLHTALDARARGFEVAVIRDGCGHLELRSGDVEVTWQTLLRNDVKPANSSELCGH
jgi:nicotinamidase/pyrazinamidase